MNNIKIIIVLVAVIFFNACSDGGSDAHFKNAKTDENSNIAIDIDCITNPDSSDIATYITLLSGDTIVREDVGVEISVYHDIDGNKKVCRVVGTGNSYILR